MFSLMPLGRLSMCAPFTWECDGAGSTVGSRQAGGEGKTWEALGPGIYVDVNIVTDRYTPSW